MTGETLIVSRVFPAPADLLWKAITEKERMKEWYFDIAEFRPEPGFHFTFTGGTETREYLHLCTVIQAVSCVLLSYSWEYQGYPGKTIVTFRLEPAEGGTKLTLSHSGLDSFPADNPDFNRENFRQGWDYLMNTSLKQYIEKTAASV
ncbi:MAG: SRPBCC domain-containing protein [Ignavibacteriales bacterium]|nr:MAG: SRPBCC domain-containing protein [Ignavibacteriales bacterium]